MLLRIIEDGTITTDNAEFKRKLGTVDITAAVHLGQPDQAMKLTSTWRLKSVKDPTIEEIKRIIKQPNVSILIGIDTP